eukprot:CAMPEP_0171165118 /NCGR_PEP_ID=MMETSP0790-20130122/6019_1 /TAXON_ID=2925 /ORGANISM="Alexandrium catenella, Strain OF101" /LENGTH=582 /DNA_ID=CAMNT_0011629895 /DNA_START=15 /DNA_END=1763 /DNA_ORIENTATION=+
MKAPIADPDGGKTHSAKDLASMLGFLLLRAHEQDKWGRMRAWAWLLTMLAAAVLHGRAFIDFTVVQAGSINAVKDYNRRLFWQGRRSMLLVILRMVASSSLQDFAAEKVKKVWRSALTTSMLHSYLGGSYYRVKLTGAVPNPDHRITSDVRSIVEDVTSLAKMLPEHATNVVGLTGVMWKTSPLACSLLWSYVLAVTMTTRRYFEKRTAPLEVAMQNLEAHLRYALLHVQECAESIAFYGAARVEEQRLSAMVCQLSSCWDRLLTFTSLFGSVERAVSWIASILPSIIMAPLFWGGSAKFADYSQMVNGFRKVKDALFFLADNFDKLSSISARVERVKELQNFASSEAGSAGHPPSAISLSGPLEGQLLVLRGVRVAVPACRAGPVRWLGSERGVSVTVAPGGTLLIQGESGVGKSSLLRAVAGLWDRGVGSIHRVHEVFFLPQQPYLPAGPRSTATSLREQLLYPDTEAPDAELRSALEAALLGHLAVDVDSEADWATALSGGERQRLVLARLLLQLRGTERPLVLLDEATSACSEQAETQLYEALLARTRQGAVVSVGHRSSLRRFHQEVIVMGEEGGAN